MDEDYPAGPEIQ